MRINARLAEEDSQKIHFLLKKTGLPLTAIVRSALQVLYERYAFTATDAKNILLNSNFVGCASGEKNLSRDYKSQLTQSLDKKHGHR